MQIKEAKCITAVNVLCPFSATNGNRLGTVCWWLHFNRQQTLAVNSAALTKEKGNVNRDQSRNNGVESARAKIALVLTKWVSPSAFEEMEVSLSCPRDTEQFKKLYTILQWETHRNLNARKCYILFDHWSSEGLTVSNFSLVPHNKGLFSPS